MRIALDARYLDGQGSGIRSYTLNLSRALLAADLSLELLLVRRGPRPVGPDHFADEIAAGRVRELRVAYPPNSPLTRHLLGGALAGERFDLYHAPYAVLPRGLRRPSAVTVHDVMWLVNPAFNTRSRLRQLVAGTFFRRSLLAAMTSAGRILTVSAATQRAIADRAPWHAAKIRVTPNGVDRDAIRRLSREEAFRTIAPFVPAGTPFVLTVGDASPHKNHLNAVRGFLEAFADRPEYRLVLVRRFLRSDPQLHRLLRHPLVTPRVIALPHVPDAVLNGLYHAARLLLHPSYHEGFGIPLLEAMAAGIPVVTANVSCLPEVAGPAALLVDPADPGAIARALRCLEGDEALRARLIAAGEQRLEIFTWEACARGTLAAYRELVEVP